MITLNEILEIQMALYDDAEKNGVEFNPVLVYQALEEQYKAIHGSNQRYIREGGYEQKMNERIDCCLNRLNATYEEIKHYYLSNGVNE